MMRHLVIICLALGLLAACAVPQVQPPGEASVEAIIGNDQFTMPDGKTLAYRHWPASTVEERAIIVAVHGFNDYSYAWEMPGPWWAARGITTYAYDQRGFGQNDMRGIWAGEARLAADLRAVVRLVARRHMGRPVYVVGESMGGAVIMAALDGRTPQDEMPVAGVVLSAPAVWGRANMNFFMRGALWFFSHTIPGQKFTGRDLGIRASDNIEMLRALSRDPLYIKETRADAIWGLVNLMDAATDATPQLSGMPLLLLYGAKDQVIPKKPVGRMIDALPDGFRLMHYQEGWHLLFRDLQRERVWQDVAAWIADRLAPLPSGAECAQTKPLSQCITK